MTASDRPRHPGDVPDHDGVYPTLAEFLRARLDEDEQVALGATFAGSGGLPSLWVIEDIYFRRDTLGMDPARVLAECEAKRRIVEEHGSREVASLDRDTWAQLFNVCRRCQVGERQVVYPCPTLRLLALPYAGHEQYREEWRP